MADVYKLAVVATDDDLVAVRRSIGESTIVYKVVTPDDLFSSCVHYEMDRFQLRRALNRLVTLGPDVEIHVRPLEGT